MLENNKIYNMSCEKGLNLLEDNSVDLIITSPPYNVDLGNNKFKKDRYDIYKDNKEHTDYIDWMKNIFSIAYKKLKSGGRVCINIGDGKNGSIPTHSDIIQFMLKDIGYLFITDIIWDKNQIGSRLAWGSFKSPSCPSFPTQFEHILVFAKESRKLQYKGETDLTKEEFIDWSLALWKFLPETKMKKIGHPAMFPEELPKRCIKMFSWKDALVIDPFSGAGTTCKVAKELGRQFIGFDISEEYCKISNDRIGELSKEVKEVTHNNN